MRHFLSDTLICILLTASVARAAHTQVQLLVSASTVRPGDTVYAAVDMKMDQGWHTYWKNPGEAGQSTQIQWQLPSGVTAGDIQWPLPSKLPPADITTYGYENEVVLIVPLKVGDKVAVGPLKIAANVSWLECDEACIPGKKQVEATLTVGNESQPSSDNALIETWRAKVPLPATNFTARAFWQSTTTNDTRPLLIQADWQSPRAVTPTGNADFFPAASDDFEVLPDTKIILNTAGELELGKAVKKYSSDWPKEISGVLITGDGAYDVKLPVTETAGAIKATAMNVEGNSKPSWWRMLLYAVIGGLILNLMPCVLPVIALKILGFVNEAGSAPQRVRALGGIYAIGVLMSFTGLAAFVIAVKAAGHQAGWGMQFGSPVFIVCLTTLVMLVAMNLFGIFEVTLSGKAFDAAGDLASRSGASGAFFNGVLATTLATPCTAPFLAPALGFAFAQSPAIILLVFLAAGFGLALPYVLLSWNPAWLKFLPKPGAWMEKFKIAMGFPMLATVVWLFNVAASSYGKNVLWLGIFLVIVAFAAWVFGEFVQRGNHKVFASIIALILLGGGYAFALEKELDWREVMPVTDANGSLKESADGIDWQPWSPEAIASDRAAGKPVLVDFTADWCLTCQVNKKTSIEVASVRKKIKDLGAVAMVGDYTHFPDSITAELNHYDRAGVPLVLVYPKNPDAAAIVLPSVLTPGTVLDALDQAAK